MPQPIAIAELCAALNSRAPEFAAKLLPGGHREGDEWVEARRKDGGLGDSLRVHLTGTRARVWAHFAVAGARGPKGGDALDLIAYLMFDDDKAQAVGWAKRWLGLADGDARLRRTASERRAARPARAVERSLRALRRARLRGRFRQELRLRRLRRGWSGDRRRRQARPAGLDGALLGRGARWFLARDPRSYDPARSEYEVTLNDAPAALATERRASRR